MKILRLILFGLLALWGISSSQTVSALINNPEMFDGKTVVVKGELIGDIINGRNGFCVNILDSGKAIGVWFSESEREKIEVLGRYGVKGDFVRIKGVFYKNCAQHTGDMDIHAGFLEILERGRKKDEDVPVEKVVFAFSLGIVSLAAIGILHLLYRRESLPRD
ncbi:MAG: DNA-binding protein [Candidatus Omnitrophica bacterium]|nr:DNA-binding protein [Candidatus Omnitrophota bacterium]